MHSSGFAINERRSMRLLWVQDGLGDDDLVREALRRREEAWAIEHCACPADALTRRDLATFDVVLIELCSADGSVPETVYKICRRVPGVPCVVLAAASDDDRIALRALSVGAQD